MTPERADSIGKGTRMMPERFWPAGTGSFVAPDWNCQTPFRFIQFERTICGRGYSGRTLVGFTCWAQSVISGACLGCQGKLPVPVVTARSMDWFRVLVTSWATIPVGNEPSVNDPLPLREPYCTSGN